ncbi:hypothetical protein B0H16DRAFT_1787931 [Mycena metata]|uniref:Uncharacterized protein n=1 Tax=Mycena metata TaxID=1033252 RepID=A0AAD7HL40_9AGAR|nr:hypothetical protein B0H16DRAFT_1787931 [Mycena metata]
MLRGRKRLLALVIAPLLGPEDNIFDLHQHLDHNPQHAWLELGENFSPPRARPDIGGTRISRDWLYSLKRRDCEWRFRFYAEELEDLVHAFDIPAVFKTRTRCVFDGIEALCLLLARFTSAGDQFDMSMKYNRSVIWKTPPS